MKKFCYQKIEIFLEKKLFSILIKFSLKMKHETDGFVKISPQQPRRKENFHNSYQPQYLQNTRQHRSSPKHQYHHQQLPIQQLSSYQLINSNTSTLTTSTCIKGDPAYSNISSSSTSSNGSNKGNYVGSYPYPILVSSEKKLITANPINILSKKSTPEQINCQSPTRCYAGAKFWDAPSPRVLPLPPAHWIPQSQPRRDPYNHIATHLKAILQVA